MTIDATSMWPLCVAAVIVLVSLLHWRMQHAVQPLRLKFAEAGERFLASSAPTESKSVVEGMLGTAFNARGFLLIALVVGPVAVWLFVFNRRFAGLSRLRDPELELEFQRLSRLHDVLLLANHPLLFPLVIVEVAVVAIVLSVVRLGFDGDLPADLDRVEALRYIGKARRHPFTLGLAA